MVLLATASTSVEEVSFSRLVLAASGWGWGGAGRLTLAELLNGLHSWSREQRRYDHPAMKTMRKAKRASLDTICH